MTETAERAAVACPSCSPDLETVHEVLTTGGGRATVRCTECGHTHKRQLATPTEYERDVARPPPVVSTSWTVSRSGEHEGQATAARSVISVIRPC